jgi:CMP-N,N'-diacetyllegionaminic acid synthase
MTDTIAIILARAGSKGVPGKNSALIAGRPCACWTIEHAQRAATISRVTISTDDTQLQELGVALGIDVVARPAALATDSARVDDAARHAIETLGISNDAVVVLLYANVPVRPDDLIDRCVRTCIETGADSVQSYAPVGKHHPLWTCRVDPGSAQVAPWQGHTLNGGVYRRQDLPDACIPDGGCLVVRASSLMNPLEGPHGFLGADRRGVRTGEGDVIDIDTPIDLIVADAILKDRAAAHLPEGIIR